MLAVLGGHRVPGPMKRFTVRFRVAFPTKWGENLVVSGSDVRLGAWDAKKGLWMSCHHVGDLIVWQARCRPRPSC